MSGSAPIGAAFFQMNRSLEDVRAWSRTLIGILVNPSCRLISARLHCRRLPAVNWLDFHAVRQQGGAGRTGLKNLILQNVFDPKRGIYVPVAADFYLKGKLPEISRTLVGSVSSGALTPFPVPLFTNALLIPPGYGADGFRPDEAPRPLERATNAGFLIVTIEFDCQGPEQFEENLIWTRSSERRRGFRPISLCRPGPRPAKGKGVSRLFHRVQRQQVPALPFYLFYETPSERPVGAVAEDRLADFRRASAILHNVHNRCWDHVDEAFVRILKPSMAADRKLRSLTQWRRAPWGLRSPEDDLLLGLGTPVPATGSSGKIRPGPQGATPGFWCRNLFAWPILSE